MSSYVFELTDVSIASGSDTLQINNSDSVFGVIAGSAIFIAGNRPRFVQSADNVARTVTLSADWGAADVENAEATIIPLAVFAEFLKSVDEINNVNATAAQLLARFRGLEGQYQVYVNEQLSRFNALVTGKISKATLAELTADLAHDADTLAEVWNDPLDVNNGLYGKIGASGSGSWQPSKYDTLLAKDILTQKHLSVWQDSDIQGLPFNSEDLVWGICDSADRVVLGITPEGKTVGYLNKYVDDIAQALASDIAQNNLDIRSLNVGRDSDREAEYGCPFESSDIVWGICDKSNNLALGITSTGDTVGFLRTFIDNLYAEIDGRLVAQQQFATDNRTDLFTKSAQIKSLQAVSKAVPFSADDVVWAVTDSANNVALGITSKGKIVGQLANEVSQHYQELTGRLNADEAVIADNQARSRKHAADLASLQALTKGLPYNSNDIVWGVVDSNNALILGATKNGQLVGYYSSKLDAAESRLTALESATAALQGSTLTPDDAAPIVYTNQTGTYQQVFALDGDSEYPLTPDEFDAYHPSIHRNSYLKFAANIDGTLRQWRQTLDSQNRTRAHQQKIQHVLIIGQSNSIPKFVAGTTSPLTTGTLDTGAALQFAGDEGNNNNHLWPNYFDGWVTSDHDTPLTGAEIGRLIDIAPNVAESHAYGFFDVVSQGDTLMLFSGHGRGGANYNLLRKGTDAYANSLACVTQGKVLASRLGLDYEVVAIFCEHGESDSQNAGYLGDLTEWLTDYNTDIKEIAGQSGDIPLFLSQQQSWPYGGNQSISASVIAQLEFHENQPLGRLVAPKYFLPHDNGGTGNGLANDGDGIHLSGYGIRTMAEYYAKAYQAGAAWSPLRPASITFDGSNTITVSFAGRVGALQLNEYHPTDNPMGVSDPGHYGFELHDPGSAVITNVALSGDTTQVLITTDKALTAGAKLAYAYTAPSLPAEAGPLTGPRGCLCDSDPTPPSQTLIDHRQNVRGFTAQQAAQPLFNWCVTFIKNIDL